MTETTSEKTRIASVVDRYLSAVHTGDRAAFLALFTDDCEVIDPYPVTRYDGREGVAQWWDTLIAPMPSVHIEMREQHVCGDRVAAVYTTTASPGPGTTVTFSGVDLFTIVDDSKIAALHAYWDPTTISIKEG